MIKGIFALAVFTLFSSCSTAQVTRSVAPPPMRWDHREEAAVWTEAALSAMQDQGLALGQSMPSDVTKWCPGYPEASQSERDAFWVGLLSALAKHESTWNPKAVGGGGRWFGLVQIAPATARGYGCTARSGEALKDGSANLSCAIRILSTTVPRDGVVAAGGGGIAADWGPFVSASKRADMAGWTKEQPYCQ
ncbi:transglycosylase SLT domain-containing protein [Candidatus Halocynthiibacter alkanivorans]|uniref:transglycosylase SLT domain-containing protein n=1 Tax=Candidatus Halocynthiibacter alkanivorans TaxID=2267619 RepID=UPI000DF3F893|nr:transglycosylase SLT domain-containing protein [Candidatus Halocynthiibacter alkanivorans]